MFVQFSLSAPSRLVAPIVPDTLSDRSSHRLLDLSQLRYTVNVKTEARSTSRVVPDDFASRQLTEVPRLLFHVTLLGTDFEDLVVDIQPFDKVD